MPQMGNDCRALDTRREREEMEEEELDGKRNGDSRRHTPEHPSPERIFPSSHCSGTSILPFPQIAVRKGGEAGRKEREELALLPREETEGRLASASAGALLDDAGMQWQHFPLQFCCPQMWGQSRTPSQGRVLCKHVPRKLTETVQSNPASHCAKVADEELMRRVTGTALAEELLADDVMQRQQRP